jgi:16S rRNA (uracil1498-N3)-methyltransferase
MAYEGESGQSLRSVLEANTPAGGYPRSIAIVIGPEGGFDRQEVQIAEEKGARTVTLGPRILRTETAGLVAAAMILYHYGQMGG